MVNPSVLGGPLLGQENSNTQMAELLKCVTVAHSFHSKVYLEMLGRSNTAYVLFSTLSLIFFSVKELQDNQGKKS